VTGEIQNDGEASGMQLDLMSPDSFEATFTFDEDGEVFEFSVIGIGDELYEQFTTWSSDWFIAPEEERADFGGTGAFATALTTEISDLTRLGEEDIDGVATHHLQGSLAREVLELVETEGTLPESTPVEMWVGKEDSLVRRYVLSPSEPEQITTFTLSRFDDEAISIEAPADPRPADEFEEIFEDGDDSDFSTPEELQEAIAELPAEQQECLRSVWGDAVYEELAGGERLFTEEEEAAGSEECFTD
jgi:hypothetical protein